MAVPVADVTPTLTELEIGAELIPSVPPGLAPANPPADPKTTLVDRIALP